jgi:hypothetical protein
VEAEATLPGGLREEARVYLADASAYIVGCEASGSRMTADGRVNFHALYAQGNLNKLSSLDASADFAQQLTLPKETPNGTGMDIRAMAAVQQVSTRVFNGRLLFKAVLQLNGQIESAKAVDVIASLNDVPDAETQDKTVKSIQPVGRGETEELIRQEVTLPKALGIAETLFGVASVQVKDLTGGSDGKVGVSGEIHLEAYHALDDPSKPLLVTRHTIPFEQSVLLTGALGDAVSASANACDVAVASADSGNERLMRVEVLTHTRITAMKENEQKVLTDVYATGERKLEPAYVRAAMTQEAIDTQTAESGKTMIMLPDGTPRVSQPLAAFVRPVFLEAKSSGDHLTVNGVLNFTLIYRTDNEAPPVSVQTEEPFTMDFKTNARPGDMLSLTASDAEMNAITGDRVEVKYILHLTATGARQTEERFVTELTEGDPVKTESGIDLYFVQPGETMWQLGKRARVSVASLRQLNEGLTDTPETGSVVMTYKQ